MITVTPRPIPQVAEIEPELIIFDKDGTLIDFHTMWGVWVTELAQRLEAIVDLSISDRLFEAMEFDPVSGHIEPNGPLAVTPMAGLRTLTVEVLNAAGLSFRAAEAAVMTAWHVPDPVALARPVTNLAALFGALRFCGTKIAIATSDDRLATEATLAKLGVAPLVDAVVCADDGLPLKPAPEMVLAICRTLKAMPAKTVVVGDNVADLQMGRAAGAGLTIGVLSGVSSAEILAPYADLLLPAVDGLIEKENRI